MPPVAQPGQAIDAHETNQRTRVRKDFLARHALRFLISSRSVSVLTWPVQVDVITGKNCEGSTTRAHFWRARWAGTFHPKIIYLLANERVCVGLGSANLTSGGLGENLETWRYFVEDEEGHDVLAGARKFLEQLKKEGALPTKVEIEEFILALPESKTTVDSFLSSLEGSLLDQVVSRIRKPGADHFAHAMLRCERRNP